jgi:hypothetical protein
VFTVVVLAAAVSAVLFWRLTSGPVDLDFLNARIESMVNARMKSGHVAIQRSVLETDSESWIPTLRFINATFTDGDGNIVAQLPKVGVTLDRSTLLSGTLAPSSIEITGAKLNVTRNFEGGVDLGIAEVGDVQSETSLDFNVPATSGKGNPDGSPQSPQQNTQLLTYLQAAMADEQLRSLRQVLIRRAQISLYDEANDARWFAPKAELVLTRNDKTLDLETTADVATPGKPWKAKIKAIYEQGNPRILVTTEISDFIPADAAEKIFALSQMAKLQNPLSGLVRMELGEDGAMASANADFTLGQGSISFPDYVARPISIEQGKVHIDYNPTKGTFDVSESSLDVGGAHVQLSGDLSPIRDPEGKLTAIGINLKSLNTDNSGPVLVDNVEFHGRASLEDQRLDVDDFVVLQGQTGVRLKGIVSGGEQSPGMQFAGRMRDIDADLLKQLWPPILTPKTRSWVNEHVKSGRISEGTFQVNLPPDALEQARVKKQFVPGSIDLSFKMEDVTTGYFKGLSPMVGAHGFGSLKDDSFDLTIEGANINLPSGSTVAVNRGSFKARQLLSEPVTGAFDFDAGGSVQSLVDFTGQPDLGILNLDLSKMPALDGQVSAKIGLVFPMIKDVPKESVKFTTDLKFLQVSKTNIVKGIDLTDGNFAVTLTDTDVLAQGPAKLNGIASRITWSKPRKGSVGTTIIETKLDKAAQSRMGMKLGDFMEGSLPLKITAVGGLSENVTVEADLSAVAMKVPALNWSRNPTPGTSLKLQIVSAPNGGRTIDDIAIEGPDISVAGQAVLDAHDKFVSSSFSKVHLSDELNFAASIKPGDTATAITIEGDAFDARPYIKSAISPGASDANLGTKANFVIKAKVAKVYANRGEIITGVDASLSLSGGRLRSADISGKFINGQPIDFSLKPVDGGREMKVSSLDGGATLRAANFYSKIAGGHLEFFAQIEDQPGSPIRSGQLKIKAFEVRNEAALAELDKRGKPKKSGPRRDGILFKRLTLPFTTDAGFFRLNDVELKGNDMGMVAKGTVRKGDGAICITGTMIPAQALNGGFIDDVPLIGQILTGGSGEGIFGITFALGGTIGQPKYQVNPLSALAPGFLRKFFEFQLPKSRCQASPVAAPGTIDSTY